MSVIDEIKTFVENECKKPTSKYGYEPFTSHLVPTVRYAKQLAEELGGNKEIIVISAWLHDIGSFVHGRKDHHITGARIAEDKLRELNYPPEKIELVKQCIMNHRGSQQRERKTIEEKIVAEADVLSNFDNVAGIFNAALVFEHKTQEEATVSVKEKLQRKWNQLHFERSREVIRPKYEAAMILFS